jgi:hypothetical protein
MDRHTPGYQIMLSSKEFETFLDRVPPDLRDILRELRNLVAAVAPDAAEVPCRKGLNYFKQEHGGPVSAGICQVLVQDDHIRLAFIHGALLPDPARLLEGDRLVKRFVRIDSYEGAPWEALQALIAASARFDPRSLTEQDVAKLRAQAGREDPGELE